MPTWAAIKQCRPIETLCAIWTRLSILVPSPIVVSRVAAAIDRRVGADLDIVLDDDAAGLRNLLMALRTWQIAETVLADAGAGMDDHAIADQRMQDRGAGTDRAAAPDADIRTDNRAGRDQRAGADFGARSDDRHRIDGDAGFEARGWMHLRRRGARPVVPNSDDGRSAAGNSFRATATKVG